MGGPLIKIAPNLGYRPQLLTGSIDFDVEMTHGHLVQTTTGVRGGAARQFEYELKAGCERFKAWRQACGEQFVEMPPQLARIAEAKGKAVLHGFIIDGPFFPMKFAASDDDWAKGPDGEPISRKREVSLAQTKGKVEYRVTGMFLVKQHIAQRIVDREREPEVWERFKTARAGSTDIKAFDPRVLRRLKEQSKR